MSTSVYKNASAVTALSVLKRGLGFLYRILLSRLLGAEGTGLYQTALSFYFVFVTLGSGGIPVTTSRLVCKTNALGEERTRHATVSAALLLALILTLPPCFLFLAFGDRLSFLFADVRAIQPTKLLFCGLCFSALYSALRGYFWGNKQLVLPTVLELVEECLTVLLGTILLWSAPDLQSGVLRAALAVAITDAFCFFIAFIYYFVKGGKLPSPRDKLAPLFRSAAPITSMRVVNSLVNSAVAVLLPVMLVKAGETNASATALFGVVSGMVAPVLFIPATVIGSFAFVLVPELSDNYYRKNYKTLAFNIERGLLCSAAIACLVIPFLSALGGAIGALTFSSPLAGEMIARSCPVLLPMSLSMISSGALNSMGFEKHTFLFSTIGEGCMLLCVLTLPYFIGAYAYTVGLGVNFTVCAACSLVFLCKQFRPSRKFFALSAMLGVGCALLSMIGSLVFRIAEPHFSTIWCAVLTGAVMTGSLAAAWLGFQILKKRGFFQGFLQKS